MRLHIYRKRATLAGPSAMICRLHPFAGPQHPACNAQPSGLRHRLPASDISVAAQAYHPVSVGPPADGGDWGGLVAPLGWAAPLARARQRDVFRLAMRELRSFGALHDAYPCNET